jgi:hypothetical protein
MTASLTIFIGLAVILVFLLAWAVRPLKKAPLSADDVFEALSAERHYARLPQILQSLQVDDTEFIRERGQGALLERLRQERKRIALHYLSYLEEEYRILQECSRILATLAPELATKGEFDRFRQNLRFIWNCRYLRWRLRFGLQPWEVFGTLSDMAGTITLQLEATTARLGERAMSTANPASVAGEGSSQP